MLRINDKKATELVLAAYNLLSAARLMLWEGNLDKDDDHSYAEAIDRMAAALSAIGPNPGTTAEFDIRVEALLRSDPAEVANLLDHGDAL